MKILIHSGFDFNKFSGIGRFSDEMGRALQKIGAEVNFLYGRGGPDTVYTYLDGYPDQFSVQEALDPWWGAKRFQKFISGKSYDIVHSHARWAYHSTIARHFFGGSYTILTYVHGLPHPRYRNWRAECKKGYTEFPFFKRLKGWAILRKEAFYQKHADGIVTVSQGVSEDVLNYLGLPSYPVITGVDSQQFKPDQQKRENFRSRHHLRNEDIVCLFIGSPIWRKGLFYLLPALKELPDSYRLCLVGLSADEKEAVRNSLPAQRIIEYDWVRDIDVLTEIYCGCDIFTLPSLSEGLPMVLLEALSSGLSCLVADCNGARDVIKNGENGIIVPRRDSPALAVELIKLKNSELRHHLARAGRRSVLKFTWERMARELLRIYEEILKR